MKQQIDERSIGFLLFLILVAYLFSVGVRMYWPIHFAETASMIYDNTLMINTNDGYFFASGAKDILDGIIPQDKQRISAIGFGLTTATSFIAKLLPFSLEQITLYMPALISSLVVVPIILTARLMGHTILGFFAALIGGIAWSYYNRTMVGYYDSDMFAILLQFSIFYTFMHVAYKKDLLGIVLSLILIFIYPYYYPQGISITYAMFIILSLYLITEFKSWIIVKETIDFGKDTISPYLVVSVLAVALSGGIPVWLRVLLILVLFIVFLRGEVKEKYSIYLSVVIFIGFLYFGNFIHVLIYKLIPYLNRGVELEGLHFYQVIQTVREAGAISMSTVANRISGSGIGLLLSTIGFIVLIFRHKPFVIALPLIGVGLFSYIGGLRFTVYAVPIAALSVVYLFWVMSAYFKENGFRYMAVMVGTIAMLYPNINHIIDYKVPTVLNKAEVEDLAKLNQLSSRKDYTLSWWDYGYPIWYYSDTSTLIDGGKHHNDNFIISKIMQTSSQELAANLSRLAVETYVDSNYSVVANTLFKNQKEDQLNPNDFLAELEDGEYILPKKTRDIYLYLPYRMLNIFPTVCLFGNLDLSTGKQERKISFYPTVVIKNANGMLTFQNGIIFDAQKGQIVLGTQRKDVKYFIATQNTKEGPIQLSSKLYNVNGEYAIIYMKSYGKFLIMDTETFKSMYVQMFVLGKYDENLFELVVASPYSRIYKLKI